MIGYFPTPYPDEFLYSLCARYQESVGIQYIGYVDQVLFGEAMRYHQLTFPHRLGYLLSQLSVNVLGTEGEVIQKHTLLPFFLPFLGRERADQFVTGAIHNGVGSRSSRLYGTGTGMKSCRYCPDCAREDCMQYGEAYWHRVHQLPGLPVCLKHKALLSSPVWHLPNRASARAYETAEKNIPHKEDIKRLNPEDPQSNLLLWIAEQASWLFVNKCDAFDQKELAYFYRVTASLRGYERVDSILFRDFARLAKERIHEQWLKELGWPPSSRSRTTRWLVTVLKRGSASTVRNLLVLWLLNVTVKELSHSISSELVFEPGPWPCLNPVCHQAGQDVIKSYSLRAGHDRTIHAIFECDCGFTYRRDAPDQSGATRTKPRMINATGQTWDKHLIRHWTDSTISTFALSKQLGVLPERLVSEARRLSLPSVPWRKTQSRSLRPGFRTELAIRDKHRALVLASIKAQSNPTRSQVYLVHPCAIMWLRNHDRAWLDMHLPSWRHKKGGHRDPRTNNRKVRDRNWQERDAALTTRLPILVDEIKHLQRSSPLRISKARLLRGLGLRSDTLSGLPQLEAAISVAAETPFDFALRKYIQIAMEFPDASPASWADRARVYNKKWLLDPRFVSVSQRHAISR